MTKILVIDDEQTFLDIARFHLENEGFSCFTETSARNALSALSKSSFDLILSDLKMPEMDGSQLVKKVRNELKIKIPFIIITGFLTEKAELFDSGVDAILGKPLRSDEVIACIKDQMLPLEKRLALTPQIPKDQNLIRLHPRFSQGFDNNLLQIGRGGFFINQHLVENFHELDRGNFVEFNFNLPSLGIDNLSGIGHTQWIRYEETDHLQPGIGVEIKNLSKIQSRFFVQFVDKNERISFIPMGQKTRQ